MKYPLYRPLTLLVNRLRLALGLCLLSGLLTWSTGPLLADEASARLAMDNPDNPLLEVNSAAGQIYIELLPVEAPRNVERFLNLVSGELELTDRETGQRYSPRYYDGMRFHRVLNGLSIQAGSPVRNVFGAPPDLLPDEINANALGLDRRPAVLPDGSFNPLLQIGDRQALEEKLLVPLYRNMGIGSAAEIDQRQYEIDARLRQLTVKQVYEIQGYRYTERFPTRPIVRGTVALANRGPNTNGPEFFVSVTDADWLWGRYTVIGRVVEGMDIVDAINRVPVDPLVGTRGTLIYNIRRL